MHYAECITLLTPARIVTSNTNMSGVMILVGRAFALR
jgi:hypothetical protein